MPGEVRPEPVRVTPLTVRITHPELSTWLARGQRSGVFTSTELTLFCEETLISHQWLWGHWTISFEGYVFTVHICVRRRTNATINESPRPFYCFTIQNVCLNDGATYLPLAESQTSGLTEEKTSCAALLQADRVAWTTSRIDTTKKMVASFRGALNQRGRIS